MFFFLCYCKNKLNLILASRDHHCSCHATYMCVCVSSHITHFFSIEIPRLVFVCVCIVYTTTQIRHVSSLVVFCCYLFMFLNRFNSNFVYETSHVAYICVVLCNKLKKKRKKLSRKII